MVKVLMLKEKFLRGCAEGVGPLRFSVVTCGGSRSASKLRQPGLRIELPSCRAAAAGDVGAIERPKKLRRDIDAGGDPLGAKEDGREAPPFRDLIERCADVYLPNLANMNASGQRDHSSVASRTASRKPPGQAEPRGRAFMPPGPSDATWRRPPSQRYTRADRREASPDASATNFGCIKPSPPAQRRRPGSCPSPSRSPTC